MLISAIIPNYNSVEFLPRAIDSLLAQRVPFDEIVIVDDGSTDNSVDVIHSFMQQSPRIRLVQHEKNQGVCAALNTGIQAATGDYILLGAADDVFHPGMVMAAKQVVEQYPQIGLICGNAIVDRHDLAQPFHRHLPFAKNAFTSGEQFKTLAKQQYVGFNAGGGMLMNRQAVINAGMLNEKLRWHSDWVLYFVIAMQAGFYYVDQTFITINMRKASYSEGRQTWAIQKQVLLDTVDTYAQVYPDLYPDFRAAALLPSYDFLMITLLLHPQMRKFFTLKLLWKLCINNAMVVRIGRLFPYRIILGARKWLKA